MLCHAGVPCCAMQVCHAVPYRCAMLYHIGVPCCTIKVYHAVPYGCAMLCIPAGLELKAPHSPPSSSPSAPSICCSSGGMGSAQAWKYRTCSHMARTPVPVSEEERLLAYAFFRTFTRKMDLADLEVTRQHKNNRLKLASREGIKMHGSSPGGGG
eukprot:1161556-Pelagomonas_calceolata.AAC.8